MTNEAAGWYPDGSGHRRYWDGTAWTDWYAGPDGTPVQGIPVERRLTHQEKKAIKAAQKLAAAEAVQHAAWQTEYDQAAALLHNAQTNHGSTEAPIILQKGETYFGGVGAYLIEDRAQRTYTGGSQGVSIPIASIHGHAIRYNVGRTSGTVHTTEVSTVVDNGVLYITNLRLIFVGSKATREHLFSKMISLNYEDNIYLLISVSNRQKPTLLKCAPNDAYPMQVAIALAQSDATGKRDELVSQLQTRLEDIKAAEPKTVAASSAQT